MAFDFYFAGTQNIATQDLLCNMNANLLRSYINDKKSIAQLIEKKKEGTWKGKLIIDSGAFTIHRKGGTVDVDAYIEFLNNNCEYIDHAIQLDDIPGVWGQVRTVQQITTSPIKTWENFNYMVERLTRPKMLLPVFHMGENFKYLEQFLNYKYKNGQCLEYLCISGNKEYTSQQRKAWYEKVFSVITKSNNANIQVHCLGSATLTDMEQFPFTSSDATSWLLTSALGSIITPFGGVLVSEQQKHEKNHLMNMPETCITKIKQLCEEFDIDFNLLPTDYMVRSNFNCKYLYKASQNTNYIQRNHKCGGLF